MLAACGSDSGGSSGGTAPPGAPPPPVNAAPEISGTPAAKVVAGNRYEFLPVASDADGDTLVFRIANQPVWTTFDTGTGKLDGSASDDDVGVYGGIEISVSDGIDEATLTPFSIEVESAGPAVAEFGLDVRPGNTTME